MDKLKEQLAVVSKYSFWIMCVGILLVSVVSWWMSTSNLNQQREAAKSEIDGVFGQVVVLKDTHPKHPNASTSAGMDALIKEFSLEIMRGWQLQYDQQAKVLVWPASFDEEFHNNVNKLRPIESVPYPPKIEFELPLTTRQIYRNYIERDLPKLAETIGSEWRASSDTMDPNALIPSGGEVIGADGQPMIVDTSVVLWLPESQQQLLVTHFPFTSRNDPPSTLEMLYAQEDLWVLQNVMDIIKAANDGADARHEAAIKQIDFIRIGRSAMGLAGQVMPLAGAITPGAIPGEGAPVDPNATGEGVPVEGEAPVEGETPAGDGYAVAGEGGVVPGGATGDPAWGRYVDDKYRQLDPTRLRLALTSTEPENALLAVAKRMPVRVRFKMDQRRLNKLLAECGNSDLPFEVRQVRINREGAASGGSGGGGYPTGGGYGEGGGSQLPGGYGGGGSQLPGGYGEGGGGFGGFAGGRAGMIPGSETQDSSVDPNLIDVELYGVVYIYNPVNESQLGLEGAGGTVMSPASPDATTSTTAPASDGVPPPPTGLIVLPR